MKVMIETQGGSIIQVENFQRVGDTIFGYNNDGHNPIVVAKYEQNMTRAEENYKEFKRWLRGTIRLVDAENTIFKFKY